MAVVVLALAAPVFNGCTTVAEAAAAPAAARSGTGLRVISREIDTGVELCLESTQIAPVTASVTVTPKGATADREMPVVLSCPGPGTYPFLRLTPQPDADSMTWRVRYDWRFGEVGVTHDAKAVYELPFKSGQSFPVGQGFHGTFSHTGNDEYAVDFDMPVGTEVRAARAGKVVVVVDEYTEGGPNPALFDKANYVLVRHEDGTLGEYVHLKRGGARVKPGTKVRAGDLIGLSGNVGYSRGPHLHFGVFRAVNGNDRETIPVKFRTASGKVVEPVEGETYTAK